MGERDGCKVDEVIERRGLTDPQHASVDDGLLARWRGEEGHGAVGYRTLTEWFNKRLLRAAYEANGRSTLGNRVDADYEALTGDDELLRREVAADVRADGLDPDALTSDLVSWGTVRTHLQDCLDGQKASPERTEDWEREAVATARRFATRKAEQALSAAASNGALPDADGATVDVEVRLQCGDCSTVVPFDVAVQRGYVCAAHGPESASAAPERR